MEQTEKRRIEYTLQQISWPALHATETEAAALTLAARCGDYGAVLTALTACAVVAV
jgi:hypothetical protein